jgi:hypothetical protein
MFLFVAKFSQKFEKIMYHDSLMSCIILMVLFTIAAFFPSLELHKKSYNEKFSNSTFSQALQSNSYQQWVLSSAIVCVPMIIESCVEYFKPWPSKNLPEKRLIYRNKYICHLIFWLTYFIPNILMYILVQIEGINFGRLAQFQRTLAGTQIVWGSTIIYSMYGQKFSKAKNSTETIKFSLYGSFYCMEYFFVSPPNLPVPANYFFTFCV